MGFIAQSRSSLENPSVPLSYPAEWLVDYFNGGRTDSGLRVSQITALQIPAVFTCVNIVANGMASLPLNAVEIGLTPNGRMTRRLAYDHELQDLLHLRPHPEMSSKTFRFVMMVYALLWGNAHAEILYDNGGRIAALAPRAPWKTCAIRLREQQTIRDGYGDPKKLPKGSLVYKTTVGVSDHDVVADGVVRDSERLMDADSVVYIPGLTLDGRVGQDTVWLMRQCFGLALATEKFGAKFFGNGGHPGGVLELTGNLSQQQMEKARTTFQEATGGENMHRIFVVSGATKFTPLATPNDNAQYLETRKYQNQQIGGMFQVPMHMLGMEEGVNRATAEQRGLEFVNYTLGPWIPAWDQELKYKLFTLPNQRGRNAGRYEPQFDTRALVYPDAQSLSRLFHSGKLDGYLNTNMILEWMGLNPVADEYGGEDFWQPVNMVVVGQDPPPDSGDPNADLGSDPEDPADEKDPNEEPDPPEQKSAADLTPQIQGAFPLFQDAFARYSRRKKPDFKDFEQLFRPVLRSLRDGIQAVAAADMELPTAAILPLPATDKFLFRYLGGMQQRVADFQPEAEAKRAVQAIAIEVYRELAVRKVKP